MTRGPGNSGRTPIDQMICRIEFRRSHYEGRFTPPGLEPTIEFPGFAGGVDWGGIAVDPMRGVIVAATTQLTNRVQLVRRTPAKQAALKAEGDPGIKRAQISPYPQKGTWYGAFSTAWLSPLDVPCQQPPWGLLSAISVNGRRLLWQRVLGDATDSGPFGLASHLSLPIGTPNMGGSLLTASGLTFVSGTLDQTFRAFDTATGQLLWQMHLPAGAQAGAATYVADGIQYVVIAAGGHQEMRTRTGDEVIALRLPGSS